MIVQIISFLLEIVLLEKKNFFSEKHTRYSLTHRMLANVLLRGNPIGVFDNLSNHLRSFGRQNRVHLVYQELYVRPGERVLERGELFGEQSAGLLHLATRQVAGQGFQQAGVAVARDSEIHDVPDAGVAARGSRQNDGRSFQLDGRRRRYVSKMKELSQRSSTTVRAI